MLPNLVIIGAQKCGTTSLHHYLGRHPQISMSWPKELNFFIDERPWGRWSLGSEWYANQFDDDAEVRGEASPNYTSYPLFKGVAERMGWVIPDAKLIYLVRDPVERMVSHYVHDYASGSESRPIATALLEPEENPYLARSRYYSQLERFLPYFPRERILITTQRDLLDERRATLAAIFRFLGVSDRSRKQRFPRRLHRSRHKRRKGRAGTLLAARFPEPARSGAGWWMRWMVAYPLSRPVPRPVIGPELHAELVERLRDDVERLRDLCGREFGDWSM